MVHIDEAALHGRGGKSDLPVESVRRITRDSDVVEVSKDAGGNVLNLGRKHRVVSPQLKRALLARDQHCRFPGCTHEHHLAAHHVMHWADGGRTDLDNVMLICDRHHRLLHEGGYTIHSNHVGEWYFRHGNGKVISASPVLKPLDYDASRDAFADDSLTNEPTARYASG